jgi:alpha-glucoside transport system substrate-binding protein
VIQLATYRELGGVSGALVRRAESLYADFDEGEKNAARQTLLRLVDVGDGTTALRRRVLRQELTALADPAGLHVLGVLGRHRLVIFDRDPVARGPTVEVAHEALLTEWRRLHRWIDEARDDLRQLRRLTAATAEWEAADRDPEMLMRGARLDQVVAWAADTDLALGPNERAYLDASVAHRDEQRTVERARRAAEERLRRTSRLRTRLLVGGAAIMAVVVALAVFGFTQRSEANRLAREQNASGEARRLAAASTAVALKDAQLAMLLGLQSLETSAHGGAPTLPETEEALHWAIQSARVPYPVRDGPVQVRAGPDGLTGIYQIPLADLVGVARRHTTRTLTASECSTYAIRPCPLSGAGLASPAEFGRRTIPRAPAAQVALIGQLPLAGTHVTIVGADFDLNSGLSAELNQFYLRTGIQVSSISSAAAATRLAGGLKSSGFDIALLPQPDAVRAKASAGEVIDLSTYLDVGKARRQLGDYLVDANSQGSGYYGVPLNLDLKGLVWYPVPEFEQAGYRVPRTWDELIQLSQQMVADGRTPWCIGFEDGLASGWPGTDWIEGLALRLGGVDGYDRWIAHRIPFTDPLIRQAMQDFGDVAFGDGFVRGGSSAISSTNRKTIVEQLVANPPGCWMHYQGSFLATELPGGAAVGRDVGFFVLPPTMEGGPAPTLGGGNIAVALTDRPEVREFMRWLLDPEWGATWATNKDSVFLSANVDFDSARCRAPNLDDTTHATRVELCQQIHDAVAAGHWRFDASDQMPTAIGAVDDNGTPGAFWQGMLAYVNEGPRSVDRILATIDAAWPPP